MGSKSTTFENELLLHIFNNAAIADIGNGAGLPAGVAGSLYVSLHTAALTDASVQNSGEAAYTGYDRIAVARSSAGWTVTADSVSPTADITFGECTALPGATLTYFAVGKETGTGATDILYWGSISPSIVMDIGVIPVLNTSTAITED
jgi:hypothetical protein